MIPVLLFAGATIWVGLAALIIRFVWVCEHKNGARW